MMQAQTIVSEDESMASPVTESVDIRATPQRVYHLVADVARMGEWSPEATGSRGAGAGLTPGDKFWGTNRRGLAVWVTRCTVLVADPGVLFEFDVDFANQGVSRWTYVFEATDQGCRITETWVDRREGVFSVPVKAAGQLLIPGDRGEHNRRNMKITLQKLKQVAESA